jgi:hypothetical protein
MTIADGLAVKDAVRDVIMRYFLAADEGRADDLGALCTEDAALNIHYSAPGRSGSDLECRSRSEIVKHAATFGRALGFVRHHCTTCLIEVDDHQATASFYYQAFNERGLHHFGRIHDRFVRVDEKWLIAHRQVTTTLARSGAPTTER